MAKLRTRRVVTLSVAAVLLTVGVVFLLGYYHYDRQFAEWQDARPIDIPVDLSKPGTFSGRFIQTCRAAHGEAISLVVAPSATGGTSPADLIRPLRLRCVISDLRGLPVVEQEFRGEAWSASRFGGGDTDMISFSPFPEGEYNLTLTIAEGAPALAGMDQRLQARYLLCGLERFPATVSLLLGAGALVVAGIILLLLTRRKEKQSVEGSEAESGGQT